MTLAALWFRFLFILIQAPKTICELDLLGDAELLHKAITQKCERHAAIFCSSLFILWNINIGCTDESPT